MKNFFIGMAGAVLIAVLFVLGFVVGVDLFQDGDCDCGAAVADVTPTDAPDEVQMTVQFVSGNGRAVRVAVLDPGNSGIDDLLGVFERPEVLLEFDDARAALFLSGDQFVVWCDRHGPEYLRFDNCSVLPVLNRQY
jgi:hypothetical protein